jgi:omega-6 fatty acid desaturase (delta-12 desaturase)
MVTDPSLAKSGAEEPAWRELIGRYQAPDLRRSLWQIANTIPLYFGMLYLMARSLEISYWLTLALAPAAAGLLIRTFIIFHDCAHGSFFKSQKANQVVGWLTGVLTFTPYDFWRREHAIHHATSGDLSRRGTGDVATLTVKEYLALPPREQLGYRLYRNPLILFFILPQVLFLITQRFANPQAGKRERQSVYWTNLALAGYLGALIYLLGLRTFLLVQYPILLLAFSGGLWLFYVQHQFEGTYWEEHENWDYVTAALKGSSFYRLPKVLQWFTGNIGFHHIHHLSPRIPNYHLEACYNEIALFREIEPVTLRSSLKSLGFRFWDDAGRRLVGYGFLEEWGVEGGE